MSPLGPNQTTVDEPAKVGYRCSSVFGSLWVPEINKDNCALDCLTPCLGARHEYVVLFLFRS